MILTINAIFDLRRKAIPVYIVLTSVGTGIVYAAVMIYTRQIEWSQILLAVMPGLIGILFSFLCKGIMGIADGILIATGGFFYFPLQVTAWLCFAFFFSFLVSLFLVVMKKTGRKKQIPFVPFLCLSSILVGCVV